MNLNHTQHGNSNAHTVSIGNLTLFFSYNTCIAFNYCDPISGEQLTGRSDSNYSVTTAAHYKKLGCAHYPQYDEEGLHDRINDCLVDMSIHSTLACRDPFDLDFTTRIHKGI